VLRELAEKARVHVVSAALPPGESSLPIGAGVTGEGVDWLWHPYPLSFIPGATSVARIAFALAGRPFDAVHFADRDRELGRAALRRVAEGSVDVVIAVGPGVTASVRSCGVPVIAVNPERSEAQVPQAGRARAAVHALDHWAAQRQARRAYRLPVDVVAASDLVDAATRVRPGAAARPRTTSTPHSASIVIPTANRPTLLRESLRAVAAAANRVPGTEVIVVEQGSRAASEICAAAGIDAVVVHDDGRGASRARNLGAIRASGDLVLFTDDDCLVPDTWVADHLAAFDDDTVVGTFGAVTGLTRAVSAEDPVARARRHRRGALPWHVGHGSNMAVRRDVLIAAGGWDERIGPGTELTAGEDADLIVRLLDGEFVVRSGVGAPVSHIEWRSKEADAENLRAYEFGAGVWIGKALRGSGSSAFSYVRARRRLFRMQRETSDSPPAVGAFLRGMAHGLRLR
jgi:glycosyltransferase involved in cell wall biosynthesis